MTVPACAKPKKIVAIIQARMGSSRLPGKMLEPLAGEPLLYHIITRAGHIRCAGAIYLATTDQPIDNPLAELAQEMGLKVVRGSEKNVMERFFLAIDDADADYIVRICGDAPLFDPELVDHCAEEVLNKNADFVTLGTPNSIAHQNPSIISRCALDWSRATAPNDPRTYEHITAYAFSHTNVLKMVTADIDPIYQCEYKLSIDTPEDLSLIRKIYSRFYKKGNIVSLREVVEYIQKNPEILNK